MSIYIDATKNFGDFDLNIKLQSSSRRIGIIGASGSGKSMTLRLLSGLSTPDEGVIKVNDVCFFDSDKSVDLPTRKRKTGFLFQNYALFPNMTLEENVLFSLDKKNPSHKAKAASILDMLGLQRLKRHKPSQLSGGQKQRAALARALSIEPDILMLDEPFSALDNHLKKHTMDKFSDYLKNYLGIILFVTHNMEEAYRYCDEIVVVKNGRVDSHGKKEHMFLNPPTKTAAKLSGYRNISPVAKTQSGRARLVNYGFELDFMDVLKPYAILPGRALSLGKKSEPSTFSAFISEIIESPFSVVLYLEFENGLVPVEWNIKRSTWEEFKIKNPMETLYVKLDPDKILFID